ncbi:hypothetical protein SSS_07311 [Sarcoptes scabiei]|nr:hypothetical protein SSS_07311 [Sarcoptes scabiei]
MSESGIRPDYDLEISHFKENIKSEAESLVLKTFPKKTLELHNLLESPRFSLKNLDKIRHEVNIPIPEYPYITPVQSKTATIKSTNDECDDVPNGPSRKRKFLVLSEESQTDNKEEGEQSALKNSSNHLDGSRVLILPYGSVRCNIHIIELIDIVKPLIRQLVDDTNLV